jgi:serine/threonine-protein kinase
MSRSSDRDLLLGLLALQNDFIDRDALIDAFHRWTGDRSRTLDRVLLDRGVLSPNRHTLLTGLVEEHVKLHDDDPEKSLAALSSIGSVREELTHVADRDFQASLALVSAARPETEDDPYRTIAQISLGESTSAGSRFKILRPRARGGLGEVFLARDTELNRDVALKVIQDRYADDARYRHRFELEAQVTGGLEHPGVVPVHGLGHTSEGRPYYAMRFIRGQTLKEAITEFHEAERHSDRDEGGSILELRELLGRFIDVCDTVAYAHSRGIVHRDLKPGNIMLGKYGETLVVDWGLAKPVDEPDLEGPLDRSELPLRPASDGEHVATLSGTPVGTPAYMSPEQVDGRRGRPGLRSDIYGLGATLYHLLTGQAPCHSEQLDDVYGRILAADIPPPRSLNPRIDPALESICLKAMALEPDSRYATAQELKADLGRWLAGEPVSCYREHLLKRTWRSGRRNPWVVRGIGLATIFLILLFIFSSMVLTVVSLVWAVLGAVIGTLVGAARGEARVGARHGAQFGFQVGTAVAIAVLLVYGLLVMAFRILS